MNDELKGWLYWAGLALGVVILLLLFWKIREYSKERENQIVTVERVTGKYRLVSSSGPSPFVVTVKEVSSGLEYKDSFVSADCPLYQAKAVTGMEVILMRFTNMRVSTNEKQYFFRGAYEQMCTNKSFDPKQGANYYEN